MATEPSEAERLKKLFDKLSDAYDNKSYTWIPFYKEDWKIIKKILLENL